MHLSARERLIFYYMRDKLGQEVSLDEIVDHIRPISRYARGSVNSSIKMLSYKLSSEGYSLVRCSKVGRSSKAVYRLMHSNCNHSDRILYDRVGELKMPIGGEIDEE